MSLSSEAYLTKNKKELAKFRPQIPNTSLKQRIKSLRDPWEAESGGALSLRPARRQGVTGYPELHNRATRGEEGQIR